jgi:hypothetical protein
MKAVRCLMEEARRQSKGVSICLWRDDSLVFGAERSIDFRFAVAFVPIPRG